MGVQIPHVKGKFLRGNWAYHCKVWGHYAVICAKTAEPMEMPVLWAQMGPRNHVLDVAADHPMGRGNFGGKGGPL